MATTKSMPYDHPAYTSVRGVPGGSVSGNVGKSTKYTAFTAELLKSVVARVEVAGTTSGDVLSLITITGTTTTTTALTTAGSASPAAGAVSSFAISTAVGGGTLLNQGDEAYLVKGADATLVWVAAFEVVTQPLASVTY